MSRRRVLITDYAWPDLQVERALLDRAGIDLIEAEETEPAALAEAARDVDGLMTCWVNVPAEVIDAASRCRVIARLGIGLDNIDVAVATQRGIVVTNVPDYCLDEVAEHALGLLLALARNIGYFNQQTKSGVYDLVAAPPMRRVAGRKLGIVGFGRIGRTLADRARGLGLDVLVTSRTRQDAERVRWCSLDELLAESDYVSLHLPLTDETRHLIGARELALMKPTALLINTARGGLVDHQALAEALAANRLAGAGLDVQEPEPPDLSQPPYNDPRVIVTPHAAFLSEESLAELRRRATASVIDVLCGRRPANVVNPAALP